MAWLPLLLVILLSLHEWLFQPLLVISAALFELQPLPWLLLAGLAAARCCSSFRQLLPLV